MSNCAMNKKKSIFYNFSLYTIFGMHGIYVVIGASTTNYLSHWNRIDSYLIVRII